MLCRKICLDLFQVVLDLLYYAQKTGLFSVNYEDVLLYLSGVCMGGLADGMKVSIVLRV